MGGGMSEECGLGWPLRLPASPAHATPPRWLRGSPLPSLSLAGLGEAVFSLPGPCPALGQGVRLSQPASVFRGTSARVTREGTLSFPWDR